jgi:DNA-directed RNA polymerase subunit RPC12/RpoP
MKYKFPHCTNPVQTWNTNYSREEIKEYGGVICPRCGEKMIKVKRQKINAAKA